MDHNHLLDDGGVGEDGIYRSALDIEAERMQAQLDEERRAYEASQAPQEQRAGGAIRAKAGARKAEGDPEPEDPSPWGGHLPAELVGDPAAAPPPADAAADAAPSPAPKPARQPKAKKAKAEPRPRPEPKPKPEPTETDLILRKVDANMEAYLVGAWRTEPWPGRQYRHLTEYMVAKDVGEYDAEALRMKLKTGLDDLPPPLEGQEHIQVPKEVREAVGARRALKLGSDAVERDLWGMDCFTRRNITLALEDVEGMGPEDEGGEAKRAEFVERRLFRAIQSLGPRGWDLGAALDKLEAGGEERDKKAVEKIRKWLDEVEKGWLARQLQPAKKAKKKKPKRDEYSDLLEELDPEGALGGREEEAAEGGQGPVDVPPEKRSLFRVHPKGTGVVCARPGGVPAGTFVEEYLGELFPPWRWFERQDAMKKLNPNAALPDFYNITLERPPQDPEGYDVVFVEAATRGSFASRLSHSCDPNCRTGVVAVNGRLTIAMYTFKDVEEGEELTWDYACVTESEKEYRAATCLCGTSKCRGSFLYYANSGSYTQVMAKHHHFVDRSAAIFRASAEPVTDADRALLEANGLKSSALHFSAGGTMPGWAFKWAALITRFIDSERGRLAEHLVKEGRSEEDARLEALGVRDNRLMNLTITVDKLKYCLRQPGQNLDPPFRVLSEEEVVKYLWVGSDSIVGRLIKAGMGKIGGAAAKGGAGSKSRSGGPAQMTEAQAAAVAAVEAITSVDHKTLKDVQAGLHALAKCLWGLGPLHHGAGVLLTLFASTESFFSPTAYHSFASDRVDLSGNELQKSELLEEGGGFDEAEWEGDGETGPTAARGKRGGGDEPTLLLDAIRDKDKLQNSVKKYLPGFIWGQLSGWFKQTVYQPDASLSADRRGSLSLPDPESAYGRQLGKKEYDNLLAMLAKDEAAMWPTGTIWSFKNPAKVYGSPMLDDALARSRGAGGGKMAAMLAGLKKRA